jgi:hypothetical protein
MVSGTTLIVAQSKDGLIMAVDGRGHSKNTVGESIVDPRDFKKLFVLDGGILLASHGLIELPSIEYKFENWVAKFVETYYGSSPSHNPQHVAAAIDDKMRKTFDRMEISPDDELWKMNPARGSHLVSYLVSGYPSDSDVARVYEITAQLNFHKKSIEYVPIFECRDNPLFLGAYRHAHRARRAGREHEIWMGYFRTASDTVAAMRIPTGLQKDTAAAIAFIQVEGHFNPKHVGMSGTLAVVEHSSRKPFTGTF